MALPRTALAGRYPFAGLLKSSQANPRWVATEMEGKRRVVAGVADAGRLAILDAARGVKHRHLAAIVDVLRDVDPAALPEGAALSVGAGVVVAEFVPGSTLRSELLKGGMNSVKVVAWLLRLADAVQALHAAGAVHGAISPRSVIAIPEGRPIAPVLSQVVAPPIGPFCPPERLKGAAETAPDDVWALHAVLYTALTRELPYNAPTRDALLKQMLAGRPKPLSAFGIDEPVLQEILDRGLSYEKRVRVTELPELVQLLDSWERDPRAMPSKRQIPPRPATRGLMDIVGGTGLGKERDDGVVIYDRELPDDEGADLSPKPSEPSLAPPMVAPVAAPPPAAGSSPNAALIPTGAPPVVSATATPIAASSSPVAAGLPATPKRPSINPFERKRAIWPLLLIAALASGGLVYLAVAPDAPPAKPKVEALAPPPVEAPTQQVAERPKRSADEERDACVASYFEEGAIDGKPHFEFLCAEEDFRKPTSKLFEVVHPAATKPEGGVADDSGAPADVVHVDGGARASYGLEWYELPAAAIIRKNCCPGASAPTLPETGGWCEQLEGAVRRIADNSSKAGDLAPDARTFDKAVTCLFANKLARPYDYDKPTTDANRAAFQLFLSRAAISEARR
ncbi:MAG TPA: hypothetical protein VGI10_09340 [Polyangiaceae bacterium]|jgi:hypothetical protein